jgi:hypothetical protein
MKGSALQLKSLTSSTQQQSDDKTLYLRKLATDRARRYRHKYPEKCRAAQRKRYAKCTPEQKQVNTQRRRCYRLKAQYSLTPAEWEARFAAQGAVCAICSTDSPGSSRQEWHTDHNHLDGTLRGILCHHCNLMLGQAKDNPAILSAAISYLGRFNNGGQENPTH